MKAETKKTTINKDMWMGEIIDFDFYNFVNTTILEFIYSPKTLFSTLYNNFLQ